eukprot:Selendium_serpulae@DN6455_c0_g2_i1.p2
MKGVLESKRRRTTQGFRELEALGGRVASGDPLRDTNDAGDEERHSGRTLIERTETRSIEVFLIRDKAHITTESSNRPHDDDQDDDNVLRCPRSDGDDFRGSESRRDTGMRSRDRWA